MNEHIRASRARTQKLAWELYKRMSIAENDRDYTEIECNLIDSLGIWNVLQAERGAAQKQMEEKTQ